MGAGTGEDFWGGGSRTCSLVKIDLGGPAFLLLGHFFKLASEMKYSENQKIKNGTSEMIFSAATYPAQIKEMILRAGTYPAQVTELIFRDAVHSGTNHKNGKLGKLFI